MKLLKNFQTMLIGILIVMALTACQVPGQVPDAPVEITSTAVPPATRSPAATPTPTEIVTTTDTWQVQVEAIKALTRNKRIPDSLFTGVTIEDEDMFDPNLLLQPLENLQLKPGYRLDFVYYYDGLSGLPYLYARQDTAKAVTTYDDYRTMCDQAGSGILCNPMDTILTDGTEASYFQWVLLHTMGQQFYLDWHASYNDQEIIASSAALSRIVNIYSDIQHGSSLTEEQQKQALAINPIPHVSIQESAVSVRVVTFTKWGGFYETIFTLTLEAPHRFISIEKTNLVPFDIDIIF